MTNSQQFWRGFYFLFLIAVLCGGLALPVGKPSAHAAPQAQSVVTHIVISQIYGGGGNSNAPYLNDYVELFNPSDASLSVDGWSVQYASATGTTWQVASLTGSISPGQYYLVQLASGGTNGVSLPTPNATANIPMGTGAGKVALVNSTTALSGNGCPFAASVIDFVGYGISADCFEGPDRAPAPSNTTATLRNGSGCFDINSNNLDFAVGTPSPRNTTSSLNLCSIAFTATASAVDSTNTAFALTGTASAVNATGTTSAINATGTASAVNSTGTGTSTGSATSVIISEFRTNGLMGGGDEFIELYNPTGSAVSIGNWKVNKSSGCGTTITPMVNIPASVTLAQGQHYLIAGANYSSTVTPDLAAALDIADTGGIALLQSDGTTIVDQVGVCSLTTYHEGTALTTPLTSTNRSYDRKSSPTGICVDSNNNAMDFILRSPSDPQNLSSPLAVCGNPTLTPTATRTPTLTRTPSRTPTKYRTPTPKPLPPPPLLVINEFVPRPGHDWNLDGSVNIGDEYIEILNHGVIDVNLSGYSLDDEVNIGSPPYRLPSITLKPGERHVFYESETGIHLDDGGDGVRLLKPNGQLMDAYNYFVVRYPDESYCRLPDNGGADDWNQNCFPTPGMQNSLSGTAVNPPKTGGEEPSCPIADTLPSDFVLAECLPFGNNIWNPAYWDKSGWFGQQYLNNSPGKWPLFAE